MPLDGTNFEQRDATLTILRGAQEIVARPGGWHQGWISNGDGAYCARGATFEAMVDRYPTGALARRNACPLDLLADIELFEALPLQGRLFAPLWLLRKRHGWRLLFRGELFSMETAVEQYNDAPWRTQKQVVDWFGRAIARREAKLRTGGS